MLLREPPANERSSRVISLECDLAVIGGGMAGVCCAITAAREGLRVVLANDRPVLGGNASSEVRLWVLGASSHMGNNNRWAREGGVIDEILVENMYRNCEGNPILFDALLLEKVCDEPLIQLLLNTAICEVKKHGPDRIESVRGFCSQNATWCDVRAPLFADASGDGVIGFLAGAAFRMGAESTSEFGEKFAPTDEYGALLGHSLYFYTKDLGRPVQFTPPSFALADIREIPRYRMFNSRDQGCQLWWIEYGGRLDTIHDAEAIKWELWRIVYGVWNHIKNSGEFPEAETLTLEWVGQISGKRESRRFEGDYLLTQQDLVEARRHHDAVSYGGWAIDLHPADGIFSQLPACNQWHTKGVYQIPYRSMYSRNISNLFLTGRLISASHVAFGSTRVMATCAHNGQAVGVAAKLCLEHGVTPRELASPPHIGELQAALQRTGQYIPNVVSRDSRDLVQRAQATASSTLVLDELAPSPHSASLGNAWAMLLPVQEGRVPEFTLFAAAGHVGELQCELRSCSRRGAFTPDVLLASQTIAVTTVRREQILTPHSRRRRAALARSGRATPAPFRRSDEREFPPAPTSLTPLTIDFDVAIDQEQYLFLCLQSSDVELHTSEQLVTGVTAVRHSADPRVAVNCKQQPPDDIGIDAFELWRPVRRPLGRNLALRFSRGLDCFRPENVLNGVARPTTQPNCWAAAWDDPRPTLTLTWPGAQRIGRVELSFDSDFDHPMETVLMGHAERVVPHCVRQFRLLDARGKELAASDDNHQTRRVFRFVEPVFTNALRIELTSPSDCVPAALMEVRCYEC